VVSGRTGAFCGGVPLDDPLLPVVVEFRVPIGASVELDPLDPLDPLLLPVPPPEPLECDAVGVADTVGFGVGFFTGKYADGASIDGAFPESTCAYTTTLPLVTLAGTDKVIGTVFSNFRRPMV
jgi:hypothetical protein